MESSRGFFDSRRSEVLRAVAYGIIAAEAILMPVEAYENLRHDHKVSAYMEKERAFAADRSLEVDAIILESSYPNEAPGTVPYTAKGLGNYYKEVDKGLKAETLGQYSIRLASVEHESLFPDGLTESGALCFKGERIRQEVQKRSVNKFGYMAVFANGAELCDDSRAYATQVGGMRYSVYQPNAPSDETLEFSYPTAYVVAHETGHNRGLDHVTSLTKKTIYHKLQDRETDLELNDISGYLDDGMKVANNPYEESIGDGAQLYSRDNYGYMGSVMGKGAGYFEMSMFTPSELSTLAPERFQIIPVDKSGNVQAVGYEQGTPVGVRIQLPDHHPLQKIDSTIHTVVVALDIQSAYNKNHDEAPALDNRQYGFNIIAIGQDQQYVIDMPTVDPARRTMIMDKSDEISECSQAVLYVDKASDTVALGGYRHDNGGYYIQTLPYRDARAQAAIAHDADIYERYMSGDDRVLSNAEKCA